MYIYICTHIIKYPIIPITYSHEYPPLLKHVQTDALTN